MILLTIHWCVCSLSGWVLVFVDLCRSATCWGPGGSGLDSPEAPFQGGRASLPLQDALTTFVTRLFLTQVKTADFLHKTVCIVLILIIVIRIYMQHWCFFATTAKKHFQNKSCVLQFILTGCSFEFYLLSNHCSSSVAETLCCQRNTSILLFCLCLVIWKNYLIQYTHQKWCFEKMFRIQL